MKTKVKELRTSKGLTQQQLADLIHVSEVFRVCIEKYATWKKILNWKCKKMKINVDLPLLL